MALNNEDLIKIVDERKELNYLEDGFLYYFPSPNSGGLSSWMLRAIADELDRRNASWQQELEKAGI